MPGGGGLLGVNTYQFGWNISHTVGSLGKAWPIDFVVSGRALVTLAVLLRSNETVAGQFIATKERHASWRKPQCLGVSLIATSSGGLPWLWPKSCSVISHLCAFATRLKTIRKPQVIDRRHINSRAPLRFQLPPLPVPETASPFWIIRVQRYTRRISKVKGHSSGTKVGPARES